jgi:hypothetical protein
LQKVRAAEKRPIEERRLIDDRGTVGHRRTRRIVGGDQGSARRRYRALERHHRAAVARTQPIAVATFVRLALARDQAGRRVDRRPCHRGVQDPMLDPRQPTTREVVVEVGRGVDETTVDELHAPAGSGSAYAVGPSSGRITALA